MAVIGTGVYRSDNASGKELREDLLEIITDLSPKKTPIMTGLRESVAHQSIHQWLVDSVPRASAVQANAEGETVTYGNLTSPTRVTNYVQEIIEPYRVSWKAKDSEMAGYDDPESYYSAKAMASWKLKAEYALIWGTGTSGASGSGWEMTGLKKALTTNFVSYATGTSLTEERLNDILALPYNDVEDDTYELYTSMNLKRAISGFTAGNTKNIDATDKRLVNSVDVYEADAASMVKLFAHRDMTPSSGVLLATGDMILAIQPRAFYKAFLHRPEDVKAENGVSGPYSSGYIYGSLTLEYRQEAAGVRAEGLRRFGT